MVFYFCWILEHCSVSWFKIFTEAWSVLWSTYTDPTNNMSLAENTDRLREKYKYISVYIKPVACTTFYVYFLYYYCSSLFFFLVALALFCSYKDNERQFLRFCISSYCASLWEPSVFWVTANKIHLSLPAKSDDCSSQREKQLLSST